MRYTIPLTRPKTTHNSRIHSHGAHKKLILLCPRQPEAHGQVRDTNPSPFCARALILASAWTLEVFNGQSLRLEFFRSQDRAKWPAHCALPTGRRAGRVSELDLEIINIRFASRAFRRFIKPLILAGQKDATRP